MQGGAAALAKWRGTLIVGKELGKVGVTKVAAFWILSIPSIFDFGFWIGGRASGVECRASGGEPASFWILDFGFSIDGTASGVECRVSSAEESGSE